MKKEASKFSRSAWTLLLGLILGMIGIIILGYSEGLFHDKNIVRWLPTVNVDDVELVNGMVKIQGIPVVNEELTVPNVDEKLLYYKTVHEVKVKDDWVVSRIDESWATFEINNFKINPEGATLYLDLEEKFSSENSDSRVTIYGFENDEEVIVVGDLKDDVIMQNGDTFAISNMDNVALEKELKGMIHYQWWVLKWLAAFILTIGLMTSLLPFLALMEVLKEIGPMGILLLVGLSFASAITFVILETLIFAYWYLIFIIIFIVIYMLIQIFRKQKKNPIKIIPNK